MNEVWKKLNANMRQYVPLHGNMGQRQDCCLSAAQRKTAFVEQSWWPEVNMFESMPWCSFPWHKLLAGAKELLYSLNLIHEFTSLFSPKVIFAGLPGKAFPRKHAFVDISVFLWLRKQPPRFAQGQPKGYFKLKELHRTTKPYSQVNADWKVGKAQYAEFNVPTCGKIAVWLLCRETQPLWNSHDSWWPELNMIGSMPWCWFPRQKLLPKLAQNELSCDSLNLMPWVYILAKKMTTVWRWHKGFLNARCEDSRLNRGYQSPLWFIQIYILPKNWLLSKHVRINAMVFVAMAQASRWRKSIVVQSKFDPWVYILVFA